MASKRATEGQIVIRPPLGLRERIRAAAAANNRSMNAEIVSALEKAFPSPSIEVDKLIEALKEQGKRIEIKIRGQDYWAFLDGNGVVKLWPFEEVFLDGREGEVAEGLEAPESDDADSPYGGDDEGEEDEPI